MRTIMRTITRTIIIGVPSAESPAGLLIVSLACDAVGVDSL